MAPTSSASPRSLPRGTFLRSSLPTGKAFFSSIPDSDGRLQITTTMRTAISVYVPGDKAPAHIHSANASRTILTETGGYTNVEGERCECRRGDIIWTPNGTWHDHGNDLQAPVMWIDMLDWPLLEYLDTAWVDLDYPAGDEGTSTVQKTMHIDGYSKPALWIGGLKPDFGSHRRGWGQDPTPMIHFRGDGHSRSARQTARRGRRCVRRHRACNSSIR